MGAPQQAQIRALSLSRGQLVVELARPWLLFAAYCAVAELVHPLVAAPLAFVCGQRLEVERVGRENGAVRLGIGNDQCVHGGAGLGETAQLGRATRECFGQMLENVAGLESSGVTLKTLNEDDREDRPNSTWACM